ncbi:MAG: hypothetical protein U0269_36940 [Polyangiales bacterium]
MLVRASTVRGSAEAEATVRGHERFARVLLRVEPAAPLGLNLSHRLDPQHELFDFWQGVIEGVRLASCANQSLAMNVTILDALVHPVDSRRSTFARATLDAISRAISQLDRVDALLDRELFPWIATIGERAEVSLGQGTLSSEPLELALEQPLSWSCQWGTVDPAARACVDEVVRELTRSTPPWSNATLHFGTVLAQGEAPSADAIREAIRSVLALSRPVERHARAMEVRAYR